MLLIEINTCLLCQVSTFVVHTKDANQCMWKEYECVRWYED